MEFDRLKNIVDTQIERCRETLTRKNKEYAAGEDALAAFKKAAALQGETPEKALFGMLAKHIVSISDMCGESGENAGKPLDTWVEKITDGINYLLILRAIIEER